METQQPRHDHAVVVGAGIGGLLAARVLSEAFERVTVFERDVLPEKAAGRKGVPQSRQAHALLARGCTALEELFPGFTDDLLRAGSAFGDLQGDFHWYLDGHLLKPARSGLVSYAVSRPAIEQVVRERVRRLPRVTIVDRAQVDSLVTPPDRSRVTGVRLVGETSEVPASLVVDASGRGSRATAWLAELGYPVPDRSETRCSVVYVTRHYRREPDQLDGRNGAASTSYPGFHRGGIVISQEGDRWVLMLSGLLGEEPPTDDEGLLAFAESLPAPDLAEIMKTARPLDLPVKMRYPASARLHYERLDRHLVGHLVLGDALCSFNPVYGQGMTVAALEALALRDLLAGGTIPRPRDYYRQMAKIVGNPWSLSAGGDLRFPQVPGRRPRGSRLLDRYLDRYRVAASRDETLGAVFLAVANLTRPPSHLLAPAQLLRVLRSGRRPPVG